MKHIHKLLIVILFISMIGVASAAPTIYNPWTGRLDYFGLNDDIRGFVDKWFFSNNGELDFNETRANDTYLRRDGFFPMTGNLDMGNFSLENVNTIYMNVTGNDNGVIEGEITWNSVEHTLNLDSGLGPVNQVGYENWILVVNGEGQTILDGQAVYNVGSQGQRTVVKLAKADNTVTAMVIGVATMDIPINQEGIVTWAGVINDIDTSMFSDNNTFYLSAAEAGNWTTTAPLAPNFPIQLGRITNSHVNQGSALIQIGPTDVTDGMVINSLTINKNFTVSGDTSLNGTLNMNTHNITNLGDLQSQRGSLITRGVGSILAVSGNIFNGLDNAFILYNNGTLDAGDRGFGLLQNGKILLSLTSGGPTAAGYWRNSMIIGTDQGSTNASFLNNGLLYVVGLGNIPRVDFNTTQTGSDLYVQDDIQLNGTLFPESGIESRGKFVHIGPDFTSTSDFIETSLHPQIEVNFTSGFNISQNREVLDARFLGSISPFENQDVNPEIWFVTSSALCDIDTCANADGTSGSSDITMSTNVSTLDLNETELSWTDSLVNLIGADEFRVETNNFTGSGWEIQFTDTGSVVTEFNSITLGVDYWNVSTVGVRFVCDVSQLGRSCFVDNVVLNGSQTVATNATAFGVFSQICFGENEPDPTTGICSRGIYYDPSEDKTFISGPFNVTDGGGGGSGISGTANRILVITGDGTTGGNSNLNDDGSLITSDVSFLITGNLNVTERINTNVTCYGGGCQACTFYNGSALISESPCTVL